MLIIGGAEGIFDGTFDKSAVGDVVGDGDVDDGGSVCGEDDVGVTVGAGPFAFPAS